MGNMRSRWIIGEEGEGEGEEEGEDEDDDRRRGYGSEELRA